MLVPLKALLCVGVLLLCGLTGSARAQASGPATQAEAAEAAARAEAAFDEKFGDQVREVRLTRETDDDAKFAERLLSEARSGDHDTGLTRVLYEKAYAFGLRDPAGYRAAGEALDLLLEADDARRFDVAELRLALLEKWHKEAADGRGPDFEGFIDRGLALSREAIEAGEADWALRFLNRVNRLASRIDSPRKSDIRDTIIDLVRLRKTLDEIARLEEALGTRPGAADELAMVYLADLDEPAEAVAYADRMQDRALAEKVRLAATGFEQATAEQAAEAGRFYFDLFSDNQTRDPVAMLIRARVWLSEYLSREPGDAQAVQAAKDTLGEIDQQLLQRGIGKKLRRKMSSLLRGEGRFDRPADIQAAIDKGVEWLYSRHNDERHWEQDNPSHRNWGGYTALVVYALLMADEDPRINADLSRATHFMMNAELKGTYALCFRIHAWEVMPRRERYRQVLMRDVQRLRQGATRHGFWGYTMSGNDVKPGSRLDVSTTLAGGLGLWIGEEVGGVSPKAIYWERIARGLIKHQLADDGWCYNPATGQTSQGAMTAGALALLHAAYPHLGEATKNKADEAIERGLKWMDAHFSPTTNVNRAGFKNYYFAAVQHAGLFAGRRSFGEMDWYDSIAEHLVKTQSADGAMGDVAETAFAVAFLCRGGLDYEPSDSEAEADTDTDATGP